MAYLTKRIQKVVRRNGGIPKRGSSSKPRGYDLCHKCGKPGYFIKDCPSLKQDQYNHNTDKVAKRNPVPNKRFKRKDITDNVVKLALAVWGDSSSESGGDGEQGDGSMMAVESEAAGYDCIFAMMAKSDDEDNDDDEGVVKGSNQKCVCCVCEEDPVNLSHNVVCIRSDHGTEFDNAKLDEFCAENDSHDKIDQEGEQSTVPGEVIDMANGKAHMMSHIKESNDDNADVSPADVEEPDAELRSGTRVNNGSHSEEPGPSHNAFLVSNWKHKSSHPLQNVITPLDTRIQTRSKSRNSLSFSAFLSQIEPKNIEEALKDADWITAMQDELHQF
nr:uncharacterized protein LOC104119040 [Nicotiana tomentosiformis]